LLIASINYDLPIPLTHTTWNSTPPSYEIIVNSLRCITKKSS
jgi:hypothetical protein